MDQGNSGKPKEVTSEGVDIASIALKELSPLVKVAASSAVLFCIAYIVGYFQLTGLLQETSAYWVVSAMSPVQVVIYGLPVMIACVLIPLILGFLVRSGTLNLRRLKVIAYVAMVVMVVAAGAHIIVQFYFPSRYVPKWTAVVLLGAIIGASAAILHMLLRRVGENPQGASNRQFAWYVGFMSLLLTSLFGSVGAMSKFDSSVSKMPYATGGGLCNARVVMAIDGERVLLAYINAKPKEAVFFSRKFEDVTVRSTAGRCDLSDRKVASPFARGKQPSPT